MEIDFVSYDKNNDFSNEHSVNDIDLSILNFPNYESLSEAFEKDSRRYSRYLGDDLIKEKIL